VTNQQRRSLVDLEGQVSTRAGPCLDGLRVVQVPLVPEIRLHLAEDAVVWWARMEAEAGTELTAPFWASAWIGGQALARYVLDHPRVAVGRRVLDLAAGSGLAGIAASMAGAAAVTANDIDPYSVVAIGLNARANGVEITAICGDLLDGDGGDSELILAGDVLYDESMVRAVMPFLKRASARGASVLVGDPGRSGMPRDRMKIVATYSATSAAGFADAEIKHVHVLQPW
jgi:predicted nicotinamide N-methyase